MTSDEWTIGDRVYVPRITKDLTVVLKIVSWGEDEDDPNPDVTLLYTKYDGKGRVTHQMNRICKFDELSDPPHRRTKGGAVARRLRDLPTIYCGCGCGWETSGAEFRQGHDMKLKSKLLKRVRDEQDEKALAELIERHWWIDDDEPQ